MCAALARLAAAPEDTPAGPPGAPIFDQAATPDAIVMGLAGDLEQELEFAHRAAPRLRGTRWILVGNTEELERANGLFDTLPALIFTFPPEASILRAAIQAASRHPEIEPLPLSQRPARDTLSERCSRAFADLEMPELLHAFDPLLAAMPLLALGEAGTGRGTLVRYIHQFGPTLGGTLVELDCTGETRPEELLERIALASRHDRSRHATSLWLRDAHRLAPAVQQEVASWVEYGPPWGTPRTRLLRWLGTAEARGLEPVLRRALGGLSVSIPPLRERPELLASLPDATAAAWCNAHGQAPRRFGPDALAVLVEYPWPGNLRELEAVIGQSLAASAANPLKAADLLLDGAPFVPVDATSIGVLLDEDETVQQVAPEDDAAEVTKPPALDDAAEATKPPALDHTAEATKPPALDHAEEEIDEALQDFVAETFLEEDPVLEADLPEAEVLDLPEAEILDLPEAEVLDLPEAEILDLPPEPEAKPSPAASESGAAPPQPPEGHAPQGENERRLQRLAAAVGHEVRNPLTAVRTFTELLAERWNDPDFRTQFARLAHESLGRVDHAMERLERLASFPAPEHRPVDVGALLQEVLEKRRTDIHRRKLVVLEELDRSHPTALCDPEQLRFAFEVLLEKSLDLVPERGDVYLASRRHETGLRNAPSVRILLRYRGPYTDEPSESPHPALSPAANTLDYALADMVIRGQGGTLALDTSDPNETLVVLDLPS